MPENNNKLYFISHEQHPSLKRWEFKTLFYNYQENFIDERYKASTKQEQKEIRNVSSKISDKFRLVFHKFILPPTPPPPPPTPPPTPIPTSTPTPPYLTPERLEFIRLNNLRVDEERRQQRTPQPTQTPQINLCQYPYQ